MINHVEFPGLGLSFDISRVAFNIFGVDIYWYGVLIGLGMMLGVLLAFRRANSFGVDVDRLIDVILFGFAGAIIGGRLYYVLFVNASYRSFFELIDLRSGGIAIYGGIIGAAVGAVIGCRLRKAPLLPVLDLTAMGFLIGQAVGRWGNFFNQEAFGNSTGGMLGMRSEATVAYLTNNETWLIARGVYVDPQMPVHPTFLYESVWCLVGFFLLWAYAKRRRFNGEVALLYVAWYGAGRFFIEDLRTDSLYIGSFRVSQLLAAVSAVAALAAWLYFRRRFAGKPLEIPEIAPHTARVRVPRDGEEPVWVTISWPADQRAPTKEERARLAEEVLSAEKMRDDNADAAGEEDAESGGDAAEPEDKEDEKAADSGSGTAKPEDKEKSDEAPGAPENTESDE